MTKPDVRVGNGTKWYISDLSEKVLVNDGGFTIDVQTGQTPETGYIVSTYPDRAEVVQLDDLTPERVESYIVRNLDVLHQTGHYLGGWHEPDTSNIWLDISQYVPDYDKAAQIGTEHHQQAVFDVEQGKSVQITKKGEQ